MLNFFRPKPGSFGLQLVQSSVALGTGGTTVADTATTSVVLPTPFRKCKLIGLAINAQVAALSASGTVKVQVFKRNNVPTSPADVTLTAAKSIEADVITVTGKSYTIAITGSDSDTIFQQSDLCRVDVVTTNTVGTQPTATITAVFAVLE